MVNNEVLVNSRHLVASLDKEGFYDEILPIIEQHLAAEYLLAVKSNDKDRMNTITIQMGMVPSFIASITKIIDSVYEEE